MPELPSILRRSLFGAGLAYAAVVVVGPSAIRGLRRLCREKIDTASPALAALHAAKSGTPSMGGLLIFGCWLAVAIVCGDVGQPQVQIALLSTVALLLLGACDDLIKAHAGRRGLSVRAKLSGQLIIALAAALAIQRQRGGDWSGCLVYALLAAPLIAGMSNAVNLTDGLDGLAAGCGAIAAVALGAVALFAHDANGAEAEPCRQIVVLSAVLAGALCGFLRFNRSPARIFMGDTGALPLGGVLGVWALLLHQEWPLLVVGGVFCCELASVVLQVAWFRGLGRRLFRCAPLHHHFEFLGWPEPAIVRRFWAVSAGLALAGVWLAAIATRP